MICFFYLGCFQMMIVVEIPSIIILYFIAKYMLIRVCKEPRGLSLQLNNLAQSLMRFYVPLYWLGRHSIEVLRWPDNLSFWKMIESTILANIYQIFTFMIVIFLLFCEPIVSTLTMHFSKPYDET